MFHYPAAATAWLAELVFIVSSSALTPCEVIEGAGGYLDIESSGCCRPFGVEARFGLLSEARTCGRHFARSFAVGALASSSERQTSARALRGRYPKTYSSATDLQERQ